MDSLILEIFLFILCVISVINTILTKKDFNFLAKKTKFDFQNISNDELSMLLKMFYYLSGGDSSKKNDFQISMAEKVHEIENEAERRTVNEQ